MSESQQMDLERNDSVHGIPILLTRPSNNNERMVSELSMEEPGERLTSNHSTRSIVSFEVDGDSYYSYADDDDLSNGYCYSDTESDVESYMAGSFSNASLRPIDMMTKTPSRNPKGMKRSDSASLAITPGGYRMLPSAKVEKYMEKLTCKQADLLGISKAASMVLLRAHKWDSNTVTNSFYDNPASLQSKCGVLARCQQIASSEEKQRKLTGSCSICISDDIPPEDMYSMPCGHDFCRNCWSGYIESTIVSDGPNSVNATCPHPKCNEIITEEEVKDIIAPQSDKAGSSYPLLIKYREYQIRSFVEMNRCTRWCPGPGCDKVAVASSFGLIGVVDCDKCHTQFCLSCGELNHRPLSCDLVTKWNEKNADQGQTADWMLINTKNCPKCSSRIDKNGGCNHMICSQCDYHFCWICMGSWSDHGAKTGGYYACNRYDAQKQLKKSTSTDVVKANLEKYLHYYNRFFEHGNAQKFAEGQLAEKLELLKSVEVGSDKNSDDIMVLKDLISALRQLTECRRVLKYTYVFGYLELGSLNLNQKNQFEHHQALLERFTEVLSEETEKKSVYHCSPRFEQ
mmetsp:Transcript_44925/g.66086  ORF Transcript_44925/g.66086 Transcript_44925/m.66086 type:complete len:571 (+) Transcript_44925:74-1786(+)